jgi:NAD(P)-dependent dehydrogenase (short-subunit alcohol dehydrogenase family)
MSGPVLILGASGGIGAAAARCLSQSGRQVVLHGRNTDALRELAASLPGPSSIQTADLVDEAAVNDLFARLATQHGRLDGVVFSVAVPFRNRLTHRTAWAVFEEQLQTQLKALHLTATAAFPLLADGPQVTRLVVVSTEFVMGSPPVKTAPYVAAKAAMTSYAQVIAQEWLTRGVRVHIVAPGLVKTALVADMPEEFLEQMAEGMPEKQLTSATDVGATIEFLFTAAADPLYGTPLRVSRGARK